MNEPENFKLITIALAIGLLIGLERGWRGRYLDNGMRVAGLRTYGLISLLGGIWGILARQLNPLLIGFAFLGLTLILLVAYSKSLDKFADFSITSLIASLMTFVLGTLTVFGHITLSCATAVVITSLLGFKPLLHSWIKNLEQQELNATLQLLLISVVILPILPDRDYGAWAQLNPYHIWWMVVLIAGISYLGYFAIRIVGDRHGPVLTGIFGGLVSSTAVTLNLSRLSKQYPDLTNALAAGILTACATMFARTLLLTFIMNQILFWRLLSSLLIMSIFTYLIAFLLWQKSRDFKNQAIKLENPFQLGMALKFGAILVVIMLLSKLLQVYFGDVGSYFLAAASGLADVDPITLSMSRMSSKATLDASVASMAIFIAVSVNSCVKSIFSWLIGCPGLGLRVGGALSGAVVAGLIAI
ncbi:MAG: MgtC/SapB family protein [Methylobacter sp.]